jgi:hypothetical protein
LVMVLYSGTLFRNMREKDRRSLQLKEMPMEGDYVGVSFQVVSVNLATSELTARLSFRLNGNLAKDAVTPSEDLTLFLNGIRGSQDIEFARGRRINAIEAVFALDGNANYYPFDRYSSKIWIMVTKKARVARKTLAQAGEPTADPAPAEEGLGGLLVAAPKESEPLPIRSSIVASIPGVMFDGESVQRSGEGIEGFSLALRRADQVIAVSVLTMILMLSLALSILLMSARALTSDDKIELLPLSLCVSLLFGLPALRNAQPAVPPLGVLGDYISFIWAEMIVAASAIIVIWTWLIRQRRSVGTAKQ